MFKVNGGVNTHIWCMNMLYFGNSLIHLPVTVKSDLTTIVVLFLWDIILVIIIIDMIVAINCDM